MYEFVNAFQVLPIRHAQRGAEDLAKSCVVLEQLKRNGFEIDRLTSKQMESAVMCT